MFGCASSPIYVVHVDMTLTRSKVKVKGHGASEFQKIVHFKVYLLASLPSSSKLMVDYGGMGPSLQLIGARWLRFHFSWISHDFKLRGMSIL